MSRPVFTPLASLILMLCPLVSPAAQEPAPDTGDAPTRLALMPEGGDAPLNIEPPLPAQRPLGRRPVNASPQMTLDAPVPAGAWAVYGAFSLVPLGGLYGSSRLGGERLWVTAAQTAAGGAVGALPGSLLFLQPPEAGGRWAEADVAAFGAGLVLTPPLAALGTWGVGELAGGGGQGRAFLGALGGAAVGMLLGVALHGVMEEVVGNRDALGSFRKAIALGFIGSGSTVGYQWAAGGSRARRR
ncbi:hypothetical protein F0U62_00770 [Cystobacter fuscus]|uniref:hypothetical protein n=1 Tax=Cystobacter fuscus TaxID=43 RepID=UPI002B2E71FD|nr:hypothetical protein F0U62_00770 [Cystobacter fuscus]